MKSGRTMVDVVLCICTCRRPDGLRRLLEAVDSLDYDDSLTVVVVDNDAGREGMRVCGEISETFRWPLTAVHELRAGISYARNHAVRMALDMRPRLIAMLDDDEWPDRQWLREIVGVLDTTGADVVGGPVLPSFPPGAQLGPQLADYYEVDMHVPDGAPCVLFAAGNFLARVDCFRALMPEPFDPEFAESGGEDLVFFSRLEQRGFRMSWSTKAVAHETVPADRLSVSWLVRRQRRRGSLNVNVQRMFMPGAAYEAVRLAKTMGLLVVALAYCVVALPSRVSRIRAMLLLNKAIGKVMGHLGHKLIQYGR